MMNDPAPFLSGPLIVVFVFLSLPVPLLAEQDLRENQSVENGREALQSKVRYPWYDAKTDQLKRIDVEPPKDPADDKNRKSKRVYKPTNRQSKNWWSLGAFIQSLLRGLIWFLVAALFIALILAVIWAFLKYENQQKAATTVSLSTEETGTEVSSIENLPFQLNRPRSDLLSEARRHYEAGNFGEAIVYLFSYQLVQLDKHQWIRLTRGKTNRQYLGETRAQPSLFGLVENTMLAFEDVFFGNYDLSQERFEACWNRLDDFHKIVQETSS